MTHTQQSQCELAYSLLLHLKAKGMTPEQLAEKSGVSIEEIEAILRGEFDFGIEGKIQDKIGERIFVFTKPKDLEK